MTNKEKVYESYEIIAEWFDEHRSRELFEKPYLDMIISYLKPGSKILDLGCGMGQPIAEYFVFYIFSNNNSEIFYKGEYMFGIFSPYAIWVSEVKNKNYYTWYY